MLSHLDCGLPFCECLNVPHQSLRQLPDCVQAAAGSLTSPSNLTPHSVAPASCRVKTSDPLKPKTKLPGKVLGSVSYVTAASAIFMSVLCHVISKDDYFAADRERAAAAAAAAAAASGRNAAAVAAAAAAAGACHTPSASQGCLVQSTAHLQSSEASKMEGTFADRELRTGLRLPGQVPFVEIRRLR
jgi:hypothetical protein